MLIIRDVTKRFEDKCALDNVSMTIGKESIYGLVGTNGSGKSTLLRLIAGVYSADEGAVLVDEDAVFENSAVKEKIFFVSDDLYFPPQATLGEMAKFYRAAYPRWDEARYNRMCELFPIGTDKKLSTFSKGMRRQAALILAIACAPDFLLLDEAFDGLDPVIRFAVRKIIADITAENGMTVVISSHNLRELEDFCDHVGLLHNGKLMLECAMDDIRIGFTKIQAVFRPMPEHIDLGGLRVLSHSVTGSVATIIVQAGQDEALEAVEALSPMMAETIGLTLEEVFIYEMEAVSYDYTKIIF